jgi:2-methylcitrate dehydratase PrpD
VRVGLSKVVDVQCGFDYTPSSALNAQMSLRYCVAVALLDGQALPKQFAESRLDDPKAVELAARLEWVKDPELDKLYPENFAGWVAAEHDGEWVRADILNPSGSPSSPISFDGIVEKFRGIVSGLPIDAIAQAVQNLQHTPARRLLALLHSDAEAGITV